MLASDQLLNVLVCHKTLALGWLTLQHDAEGDLVKTAVLLFLHDFYIHFANVFGVNLRGEMAFYITFT